MLLDEYNTFIVQNGMVESFLPCPEAIICQPFDTLFEYNVCQAEHPILNTCKKKRCSYFTCLTYHDHADAARKHICDILPVLLGSELDRQICQHLNFEWSPIPELSGMMYVDNSLANFPFMLTNRKELAHRVITKAAPKRRVYSNERMEDVYSIGQQKRQPNTKNKEMFCLFVYDVTNRGHKFSLLADNSLIYRNKIGEDSSTVTEPPDFYVSSRHIDYDSIALGFKVLFRSYINIDSLKNKLILSPVNILEMMLELALQKPDTAQRVMQRGQLEVFASTKITFTTSVRPSKNNNIINNTASMRALKHSAANNNNDIEDNSFCYRKLQPNQLGLRRSDMGEMFERIVVRPIPYNVQKSNVPIETEYYLCLVDKTYAIDSPNRWMLLLPDVLVSNSQYISQFRTIDEIFDQFTAENLLQRRPADFDIEYSNNTTTNAESDYLLVYVLGGLLTPYILPKSAFKLFFLRIKQLNPVVEIYKTDEFIMVTLTRGIPFIQINYEGANIYVSPLELNTHLKHLKNVLDNDLFGATSMPKCLEMSPYATLSRLIVSVVFYKNRFCTIDMAKYFELTTENACAYLIPYDPKTGHGNKHFNAETNTLEYTLMFSSHPQITADGYVLNKNISCPTKIYTRSRLDIDSQSHLRIDFKNDFSSFFCEYVGGHRARKCICIAKITKLQTPFKSRIFPQTKFSLIPINKKKNNPDVKCKTAIYEYLLFKYFDEECYLVNDTVDISVTAYETVGEAKNKIFIDVVASVDSDLYDGTKFSDANGQKGIVQKKDLSRYGDKQPDLIASAFSVVSRNPLNQLKNMKEKNLNTWTPEEQASILGERLWWWWW